MSKYASKVVKQAAAWIGFNESNGTHKQIIDIYNSQKPLPVGYKVSYTDAWCATFVSAVAVKLGYTDIIPCECSCPRMITLFQKKGIWIEDENRTPNPGDIIFYDWQDNGGGDNRGGSDHVGIVEKVSGGRITVIEGNYSNSVKRRTLAVNGRYIRGYGVPKYDVETSVENVETPEEETPAPGFAVGAVVNFTGNRHYFSANSGTGKKCTPGKAKITAIHGLGQSRHPYHLVKFPGGGSTVYGWVDAEDIEGLEAEKEPDPEPPEEPCNLSLPTLKNGAEGKTVKAMQILLIGNNCSCGNSGADGKYGTATENAVMMYQNKNGLPVTGICDLQTWNKLLGA